MMTRQRFTAVLSCRVVCVAISAGVVADSGETNRAADSPPDGFRPLFDGKTLTGWTAMPRVQGSRPTAANSGKPASDEESFYQKSLKSPGKWTVQDGILSDGQDPPGSGPGRLPCIR